jgi:hypothetical protein
LDEGRRLVVFELGCMLVMVIMVIVMVVVFVKLVTWLSHKINI